MKLKILPEKDVTEEGQLYLKLEKSPDCGDIFLFTTVDHKGTQIKNGDLFSIIRIKELIID